VKRRKLVELCCGSAALTLHLHGSEPLMPFMGGKGRYAKAIAEMFGLERPSSVLLVDVGPWADAWAVLFSSHRVHVISMLDAMVQEEPRELWDRLRKEPPPVDPVRRCAVFLVLQRLAFRGKAVQPRADGWNDPGISETSAYGRVGTGRFGEVKPQLPQLPGLVVMLPEPDRCVVTGSATVIRPTDDALNWDVYLDPPYLGTTGYGPGDMTRDEVLELAQRWDSAGARVIVSEAEPLDLPGWHHTEITNQRVGKKSSWQRREWITSNAAPAQTSLWSGR